MFRKHLQTWKSLPSFFLGSGFPFSLSLLLGNLLLEASSPCGARPRRSFWAGLLGCLPGPGRATRMSNACLLPVLKVGSPRSRCCRVWFLLRHLAGLQPTLCPHMSFPLSVLDGGMARSQATRPTPLELRPRDLPAGLTCGHSHPGG